MTESSIENLLQQLVVKKPSADLDDRIQCLIDRHAESQFARPVVAGVPTGLASTAMSWRRVAVLCTLCSAVSVVIGLAIGATFFVSSDAGAASVVGADKRDSETQSDDAVRQATSSTPVTRGNLKFVFADGTRVPSVATLCGLGSWHDGDSDDARCLNCHRAGNHSREQLLKEHAHRLSSESCAICHDMTDKTILPHDEFMEDDGSEPTDSVSRWNTRFLPLLLLQNPLDSSSCRIESSTCMIDFLFATGRCV